jgi:AraC-like DNA-binding protein
MECACRMLGEGKLSPEEVCARVGYNKIQYFNEKFKERYGVTPRQFQRNAASAGRTENKPVP